MDNLLQYALKEIIISDVKSSAASPARVPTLHCRLRGEYPMLKSNVAIAEERSRFLSDR